VNQDDGGRTDRPAAAAAANTMQKRKADTLFGRPDSFLPFSILFFS
jgi:hypothetical protein